jgi:hypothetical protein
MYVGQIVRRRADEQVFRRTFFIGLLALGTYMCLRAVVMSEHQALRVTVARVLCLAA